MSSEVVTRIEELAKRGGLTIDDSDGGLYEIAVVSRNSMESSDNDVTEMTSVASESTGVDAETTGLTNDTTGVAGGTDADEVMDFDVDTVDTASVNSSTDNKPEGTDELEGTEELEGTDELESLKLASELDTSVTQLTNSSDDEDIGYGAGSGIFNL